MLAVCAVLGCEPNTERFLNKLNFSGLENPQQHTATQKRTNPTGRGANAQMDPTKMLQPKTELIKPVIGFERP